MTTSETIGGLAKALAAAQAEMEHAKKAAKNSHLGNSYADLAATMDACLAALNRHGLAVVQSVEGTPDACLGLATVLLHESGEWCRGWTPIHWGESKGVNPMQALGSAITYARRYGLATLVGVAAEDDDGNAAAPARPRQDRQERTQQQPQADRPREFRPKHPSDDQKPDPWGVLIQKALRYWDGFDPIDGDKDRKAREWRIMNDVATAAIADGQIEADKVGKPGRDGQPVRDMAKVADAVKWLYGQQPDYVREAIRTHLERLKAEGNGDDRMSANPEAA